MELMLHNTMYILEDGWEIIALGANGDLLNKNDLKLDFSSLPTTIVNWHL